MVVSVTHKFTSAIPDDPAAVTAGEVVPSNWNDTHTITGLGALASLDTITASLITDPQNITAGSVTTNANLTGPITSVGNATSIASQTGTGTKFVVDTSPTLVTPNIGIATGTGLILTSASATAFEVGANGATNPALQVDASTASSATGLKISSAAAGGEIGLTAISSGTNESIRLSSKGTGIIFLSPGATTSSVRMAFGANPTRHTFADVSVALAPGASTAAATVRLSYVHPPEGAVVLTAGTEAPSVYFNMSATRQHGSNTAVALQRDYRITGSAHSFVTAGGVITDCAALSIDGPDSAGTNTTITNSHALYIPTAALAGTVTNGYGITVAAPSGAGTLNAAINAVGDVLVAGNVKLGTAGNGIYVKEGTNGCMGTGTLSGGTLVVSTTKVTANSRIFLSDQGGTITNIGSLYISARSAGTSFTVSSSNVLDASTFAWIIFEPA